MKRSKSAIRLSITLNEQVLKKLDKIARNGGYTRSGFLAKLVRDLPELAP